MSKTIKGGTTLRRTITTFGRFFIIALTVALTAWIASAYQGVRTVHINIGTKQYIAYTARGRIGLLVSHPWPYRPAEIWHFQAPVGRLISDAKVEITLENYAPSLPAKFVNPLNGMQSNNPRHYYFTQPLVPSWDYHVAQNVIDPNDSLSYFLLPAWIILVPLGLLAIAAAVFELRYWRRRVRSRTVGLCPTCSYDLRAHAPGDKCPECGTFITGGSALPVVANKPPSFDV